MNKTFNTLSLLVVSSFAFFCVDASASTPTCQIDTGGVKPFSLMTADQPITVDPGTPDGTVVKHWDFGEFLPSMRISCTTNGEYYDFPDGFNGELWMALYLINNAVMIPVKGWGFTSNSGLYLKLYLKPLSVSGATVTNGYPPAELVNGKAMNETYPIGTKADSVAFQFGGQYNDNKTAWLYDPTKNYAVQAMAADLIKSGTVAYDGMPVMIGSQLRFDLENMNSGSTSVYVNLGTGVYISQSSCSLVDKRQTVQLPDYTKQSTGGFPKEGDHVPFDLSFSCGAAFSNLDITFTDANVGGSSVDYLNVFNAQNNKVIDGLGVKLFDTAGSAIQIGEKVHTGSVNEGVSSHRFYAAMTQTAAKVLSDGQNFSGDVTAKADITMTYY